LKKEEINKLKKAGKAVYSTLKKALDIVEPGMKIIDICNKLEENIIKEGAIPAFPVNISINWIAAHYTSPLFDNSLIPRSSLVKIDVGAHVDGYIADAAITINFNPEYEKLTQITLKALKTAIAKFRPNTNLSTIGNVISSVIKSSGYVPISNLTGHKITRYNLHAGKNVPNVPSFMLSKIEKNEVYAIEPFATDGKGWVIEGPPGYIPLRLKHSESRSGSRVSQLLYNGCTYSHTRGHEDTT